MSDNNLSIDEIIKRAEMIKAEAEKQLENAQKSLDEKAQNAIKEVTVDTKAVMEKVEQLSAQEEDMKSFEPASKKENNVEKTQAIRLSLNKGDKTRAFPKVNGAVRILDEEENDDDMKIIDDDDGMKIVGDDEDIFEDKLFPDEKTRPVIIASNEKTVKVGQLQDVPTLVARENLQSYFDGTEKVDSDYQEEMGIQMSFDGFDDEVEEVPTIDEEVAEKILIEQRREKVEKFRLFGPDKTDEELGDKEYVKSDYHNEKDQGNILSSLFSKKSRNQVQIIVTLALGAIMLLMTIFKDNVYFPQFLAETTPFLVANLVVLILTILVNYNIFLHGFNFKKGINCDLPVALSSLVILAQSIAFICSDDLWLDNGQFLGAVAAFSLLISQLGKRQIMLRVIDNFDFIINSKDKHCLENIANTVDTEIISRGILEEENPIIKTSVKTDFPTNFMEISCKTEPSNKLVKVLSPIMWVLSIVLTIVVGVMDNWGTGINMGVCALAVSTPIALLLLMNTLLSDMSTQLDKYGARVCGFDGANMAANTDAIAMEAADLFGKNGCDLHGIKTFNNSKVDDAIIFAAAVITKTKSPLANVFDDVIIGKQSILPDVENVVYEEQMGTSAWVRNCKVLVGNRHLLKNHSVEVPKESFEKKYTRKNRKALYLAINGKIIAMFIVSYTADPDLKRELKKLEKSDITLIVKSCDPYINEESIANIFGLPKGFVRVMNRPAARVFEKYSDMMVEKSPAYVVHTGSAKGYIAAMRGAMNVISSKKLVYFLTCFGAALGLIAVAFMSIIKGYSQINATSITAFLGIWNLFVLIISKMQRIGF